MDESGTHGGSPVTMMSGYIGNFTQWRTFEKQASRLFRKNHVPIFHAKEFWDNDSYFKNWPFNRKVAFADDLSDIIHKTLEVGFCAALKNADYDEVYVAGDRPKKVPQDTKYGLCFRVCLSFAAEVALGKWASDNWATHKRKTVNLVLEQGHKNAGDAVRLYNFLKENLLDEYKYFLGSISFASKRDCLPLAAADLLAFSAYRIELGPSQKKKKFTIKGPLRSEVSYKKNVYRIDISKRALAELKTSLLLMDAERMTHGLRRVCRPDSSGETSSGQAS